MGRAALSWIARQTSLESWELNIPGTEGYFVGDNGWWYEDYEPRSTVQVTAQGPTLWIPPATQWYGFRSRLLPRVEPRAPLSKPP